MTMEAERIDQPTTDPVSDVLKWILLGVAIASFAIFGWTTKLTYDAAPPSPAGPLPPRSAEFYDTTLFWQWMRLPGDVALALGAL